MAAIGAISEITLNIDTTELEQKLVKVMEKCHRDFPEFVDTALNQMGDAVIDWAIPLTRVRTGRLRSSYQLSNVRRSGKDAAILVYNYASEDGKSSYAIYNEFGTYFMEPRFMLTRAKERLLQEGNDVLKTALIRFVRGDKVGGYTFKLD